MSKLTIKFSEDAQQEPRAVVRVTRVADIAGKFIDEQPHRDRRMGYGDEWTLDAEPGHYKIDVYWRSGRGTYHNASIFEDAATVAEVGPRSPSERSCGIATHGAGIAPPEYDLVTAPADLDSWSFVLEPALVRERAVLASDGLVGRPWAAYLHRDTPVIASWPAARTDPAARSAAFLRPAGARIPRLGLPDDNPDVVVMADLISAGSSAAEARYLGTFSPEVVGELFETRPLHFLAFAFAEAEKPFGEGIAAQVRPSRHDEWLPDMIVIQAWCRLHYSLEAAAELFERAMAIGVPYYSRGLDLLTRGLMTLEDTFPKLEKSARTARRLSARVVPSETFTTVRLDI